MIHQETAETYRARKAVSAGFLWEIISECPAYAYARSVFNPNPLPPKQSLEFDIGEATHLLTLEGKDFAARSTLIPYETYQTKDARELRDQAYLDGRIPLRPKDYRLVCALHDALRESDAAELLFGEGKNEVSYTWTHLLEPSQGDGHQLCKARADRITPTAIIDLKTAMAASPTTFQRAMARDGHHLRAAWYLDGWDTGGVEPGSYKIRRKPDYIFVVVAKTQPHLVTIFTTGEPRGDSWFQIDPFAVHMGYEQFADGLMTFCECQGTGMWPTYRPRPNQVIGLPRWYEEER